MYMKLVVTFCNKFTSAPKKTGFIIPASLNAPHPYTLSISLPSTLFPSYKPNYGCGSAAKQQYGEIGTSRRTVQLGKHEKKLKKTLDRHSFVNAMFL
jgi:hypothetical protein